jgi:hypothetical protein
MGRDKAVLDDMRASGGTYRVTRQRQLASHVCVVSFLMEDDYGTTETLCHVLPLARALGNAGYRVLVVTPDLLGLHIARKDRGQSPALPGIIAGDAKNVDVLLIPDHLNEFRCAKLLLRHRDSGAYTHVLVDSGGEDAFHPMYQVGGAICDLTVVCLNYRLLPARADADEVLQWVTPLSVPCPQPPAGASRESWIRSCAAVLRHRLARIAVHGRAQLGAELWDATYESALAYLAFEAWVAAYPADEGSHPLWVNAGLPLRDETQCIAYLAQVDATARAPHVDRGYLGVPDRPHRTAVLCFDVEGDCRGWKPVARRLSADSAVTVLHTPIPYPADDSRQPYPDTEAGRETYRQAAINLAQLTGHRKMSKR